MKKIVVFTGAGMSAESGLKTFRDSDGLWEGYNIEDVATPSAWKKDPALVLQFYNERRKNILEAQPNQAHLLIAALQEKFDIEIITQNIDDLHERAGSRKVLHLHGEILKMRSEFDETLISPIFDDIHVGDKAQDGHQLRPHIVWFNEPVPMMDTAIKITQDADIFLIIGTSLVVYPAASLVRYAPPYLPIYVIDKKSPSIQRGNITFIEKPATEGMKDFIKMVTKDH